MSENEKSETVRFQSSESSDFILKERPVLKILVFLPFRPKFHYLSSPLPNLCSNLWPPPINLSLNRRKIKNKFSFYITSYSAIIRLISRVEGEILNLKIPKISPLNISSLADVRQSGINHSLKTDFRKITSDSESELFNFFFNGSPFLSRDSLVGIHYP